MEQEGAPVESHFQMRLVWLDTHWLQASTGGAVLEKLREGVQEGPSHNIEMVAEPQNLQADHFCSCGQRSTQATVQIHSARQKRNWFMSLAGMPEKIQIDQKFKYS